MQSSRTQAEIAIAHVGDEAILRWEQLTEEPFNGNDAEAYYYVEGALADATDIVNGLGASPIAGTEYQNASAAYLRALTFQE